MASVTDKFRKVSDGSTDFPNVARVDSPRSVAASTLVLDDLEGWADDTAVDVLTYRLNTSNEVVDGTITAWIGVVSGNNITNFTYVKGAADAGHLANDVAQLSPQSNWSDDLVEGILVGHNQDGSHKAFTESNIVPTAALQNSSVSTSKVADGAVTGAKISTYKTNLQTITTNTTENTITLQEGWNFITGTGTNNLTKAITYPTAFTTVKNIKIGLLSARSGTDPTAITDFNLGVNADLVAFSVSAISTSGFTANLSAENGRTLGSGVRYGFWWEVKGIV